MRKCPRHSEERVAFCQGCIDANRWDIFDQRRAADEEKKRKAKEKRNQERGSKL